MSCKGHKPRLTPLTLVSLLFLALVVSGPAASASHHGENKHDYKQEIEKLEETWRTAQVAGDIPTLDKLMSEDYVGISMSGQVNTKSQQLSRVRDRSFVLTRIDLEDIKIKLLGEVAIVTVKAAVEGTSEGVSMNGKYRYTRVYQHLPSGGWKVTNFEATRIPNRKNAAIETKYNGKPS